MPDVCPSGRRALAPSHHECEAGPSVGAPVIFVTSPALFLRETLDYCESVQETRSQLASQTDTFVVFVSTALIYRADNTLPADSIDEMFLIFEAREYLM